MTQPATTPTKPLHRLQSAAKPEAQGSEALRARIRALFGLALPQLLWQAGDLHRRHFDGREVQLSALCSIKTGHCPEDCAYCPQSVHHQAPGLESHGLLDIDEVERRAQAAKDSGADRFCMGAAWRALPGRQLPRIVEMIARVKALGLQSCMTLGMLSEEQAQALAEAGLDYYNHNLDTSPEYYSKIISTRSYQDRLDTLERVRQAGIATCSGGIVGMGESREDRVGLLAQLARLQPGSIPINHLVRVEGTPLQDARPLDPFEFVRVIAIARIMAPASWIRISAGRETMSDEQQALCFAAGANSIFLGDKLLTVDNRHPDRDQDLLDRLGLASHRSHAPTPATNKRPGSVYPLA